MEPEARLIIGRLHHTVIFKVSGRGTIRNSPSLEKLALAALEEGNAEEIIVDLEGCLYMDSTFMGVLVGINSALLKKGKRRLVITNAEDRSKHLMDTLGLSRIIELKKEEEKVETKWELISDELIPPPTLAKHMLSAHDRLEEIDAQNKTRFKEVKRLLIESLAKEE